LGGAGGGANLASRGRIGDGGDVARLARGDELRIAGGLAELPRLRAGAVDAELDAAGGAVGPLRAFGERLLLGFVGGAPATETGGAGQPFRRGDGDPLVLRPHEDLGVGLVARAESQRLGGVLG